MAEDFDPEEWRRKKIRESLEEDRNLDWCEQKLIEMFDMEVKGSWISRKKTYKYQLPDNIDEMDQKLRELKNG